MEALINQTGNSVKGDVAKLFVKIGIATEEKKIQPISAKEAIAKILASNTVEELEVFKLDERKTVNAAYVKRLKELQ